MYIHTNPPIPSLHLLSFPLLPQLPAQQRPRHQHRQPRHACGAATAALSATATATATPTTATTAPTTAPSGATATAPTTATATATAIATAVPSGHDHLLQLEPSGSQQLPPLAQAALAALSHQLRGTAQDRGAGGGGRGRRGQEAAGGQGSGKGMKIRRAGGERKARGGTCRGLGGARAGEASRRGGGGASQNMAIPGLLPAHHARFTCPPPATASSASYRPPRHPPSCPCRTPGVAPGRQ